VKKLAVLPGALAERGSYLIRKAEPILVRKAAELRLNASPDRTWKIQLVNVYAVTSTQIAGETPRTIASTR
jgi:hypothetical protein